MDRQELRDLLTRALRGRLTADEEAGPLRAGKVKSRIIEAHPPERSAEGCGTLLGRLAEGGGLRLTENGDDLWTLNDADDAFFVDTLNPRFWQLHTTANADVVNRFFRSHILRDTQLDSAWFSRSLLSQLEGDRTWMKSSFASDDLLPVEGTRTRRWRVQIEGEAPEELLQFLASDDRYVRSSALSGVGSIVRDETGAVRVVANHRGGFVFDGGSFEVAAGVVWRAMRRYASHVASIEERFQLRAEAVDDVGLRVDGDVAVVDFPDPIPNMDVFLGGLFSNREPFRLWGIPREVSDAQWQVDAVDLHVGQPIRLEIARDWLRILLDDRTCGNTIARLVTNLQHHLDARADVALAAA